MDKYKQEYFQILMEHIFMFYWFLFVEFIEMYLLIYIKNLLKSDENNESD